MKDRSATKRRDCRKNVCAVSSAVMGTAIRSAPIAHTSRLVLQSPKGRKGDSCATQEQGLDCLYWLIPRVLQRAPSLQGKRCFLCDTEKHILLFTDPQPMCLCDTNTSSRACDTRQKLHSIVCPYPASSRTPSVYHRPSCTSPDGCQSLHVLARGIGG
jgi:hypothetical protein